MLALLAVLALQAAEAARAESLLSAGALRDARVVAERLVAHHPDNAAAHLLLARTHFAWPVVGRYAALEHARRAQRLAPRDPAPLYLQMQVGYYLGSDEGEGFARDAILRILALDPDHRDVWARFQELFHDASILRKADRALARHPDHAGALARRALIAIRLDQPSRADSLAQLAARRGAPEPVTWLVRADAAFLRGHDALGEAWHDSAIAHAAVDSAGELWARAHLIAAPGEVARYETTAAEGLREFFRSFWSARDPDLLTPHNERLGEHARRLADARRRFRLLHPFRQDYHVPRMRAARADARDFQDTVIRLAARAGLDARGLTYVRHGKPDVQIACTPDPLYPSATPRCVSFLDSEGWLYRTPDGAYSVHFENAEWFAPISRRQLRSTRALMRTDRTSLEAPLETRVASAFFAGGPGGTTDVYVITGGDTAAFVVWDLDGREIARAAGRRLLTAAAPAGRYRVGIDVDSAGVRGRIRGEMDVPWFASGLAVSSLVLAPGHEVATRDAVVRSMPAHLTFAAGEPFVSYAEVYGLAATPDGRHRYLATYTFAPDRSFVGRVLRGGDPVTFALERDARSDAPVAERLVLEPGRVPAGRYRVMLAVTDLLRNVKSRTVEIIVTIR